MLLYRTLLLASIVLPAAAQPAPPPAASAPLTFEVVSIRPAKQEQYSTVQFTPDGVRATGISLKNLIRDAFNERHDSMWSGEPAWTASAYYDISAKFDPAKIKDPTDDQRRAMLRALLADRFHLVTHTETKLMPHYQLVVAKGGPKMQETPHAAIKLDSENRLYCRAGLSTFRQCTMAEFANVVSYFGLNAVVEDKTGLTARYDFELAWSPNPDAGSSIFDAVRETLGLELKPIKTQLTTIVLDRIEHPSEN